MRERALGAGAQGRKGPQGHQPFNPFAGGRKMRVMTIHVDAVYEQGMLRPLEPLPLEEHQRVTLTVSDVSEDPLASMIDHALIERARKEVGAIGQIPSLEEVQRILSKIPGSL